MNTSRTIFQRSDNLQNWTQIRKTEGETEGATEGGTEGKTEGKTERKKERKNLQNLKNITQ